MYLALFLFLLTFGTIDGGSNQKKSLMYHDECMKIAPYLAMSAQYTFEIFYAFPPLLPSFRPSFRPVAESVMRKKQRLFSPAELNSAAAAA